MHKLIILIFYSHVCLEQFSMLRITNSNSYHFENMGVRVCVCVYCVFQTG